MIRFGGDQPLEGRRTLRLLHGDGLVDEHGETSFTNILIYDPKTDTWEDRLDNVEKGEAKPFARFKMTRR